MLKILIINHYIKLKGTLNYYLKKELKENEYKVQRKGIKYMEEKKKKEREVIYMYKKK